MSSDKVISYFNKLPINKDLAFSNISRTQNQSYTHAYHRYPAKFIPKLAEFLITQNTKENDLVCDPFGGCGTTLVEAKLNGRNSIGIDINPLASMISKVKITPIEPLKVEREFNELVKKINKSRIEEPKKTHPRLNYWFDDKTLKSLYVIYKYVEAIEDLQMRRFFECGFSNILKNCSRWLMSSLKPQVDKEKVIPNAMPVFIKQIKFMMKRNQEFYKEINRLEDKTISRVYRRDARSTGLPSSSIDYIITSPPYVTSYEYADLHQLGLLWFYPTESWVEFKKKFMGTSHRASDNKMTASNIGKEIVNKLMYNDKSLAHSVNAYYEDMEIFLQESMRILKKGKKISIVIGNTKLKNVDILNAEVAYEQMLNLGFKDINVLKRQTAFQSIAPFRDITSGKFTSLSNPNKRRAYQYEYIITAQA